MIESRAIAIQMLWTAVSALFAIALVFIVVGITA